MPAKTFRDPATAGAPFDRLFRIAAVFLAVALLTQVATVAEVYAPNLILRHRCPVGLSPCSHNLTNRRAHDERS